MLSGESDKIDKISASGGALDKIDKVSASDGALDKIGKLIAAVAFVAAWQIW